MSFPPIQNIDSRNKEYARPNQTWQCGKTDACPEGPNQKGLCPHKLTPCVPQRSIRSKKRLIKLWFLGLLLGCISLFLSLDNALEYLSPGPLNIAHAEMAECQDCHQAASGSMSTWITKAITLANHHDDQQCLDCHALGDTPFAPHSTSNDQFNDIITTVIDATLATTPANPTPVNTPSPVDWDIQIANTLYKTQNAKDDDVSCSSCHREHQGRFHPVKDFNENKCHSCHQKIFDDVEHGHPEFQQYPHTRNTRIQFNHVSHFEKHFNEDDVINLAPEACGSCHQSDETGEFMMSNSFEQACSSCHLNDILGISRATDKGISVLAIPELDTDTLTAAGYNIGQWPQADGGIPPMMKLLLQGDPKTESLLQNKNLELYDLSEADSEQLESAARLAWQIKQLFSDLAIGGTSVIQHRLGNVLSPKLDPSISHQLIASLPRDTLINNQKEWFPNLADEISRYQSGEMILYTPKPSTTKLAEQTSSTAVTVRDVNINGGDILADDNAIALDDEISLNDDAISLSDDDEISLSDDAISLNDDDEISLNDDAISLSDDDEISLSDDAISLNDDSLNSDEEALNKKNIALAAKNNEDWSIAGGWYLEGSNIRYRPAGHNDRFFKSWLDASLLYSDYMGKDIFALLSGEQPVGNCVKCHSIENTNNTQKVNWKSFQPKSDIGAKFTRFSHVSHYSVATEGCTTCHLLNKNEDDKEIKAIDASFMPMEKNTCTQCHTDGRAPTTCLTCHQYHAQPNSPTIKAIDDMIKQIEVAK